ncbi:oligosaccharide flippase family protein [Piscinibacter sp. XHJ-5]|uniref:oligosaccharide flippase family protein n=1 Tax=Piscinibacter sp. XHJ-5 TaxID=3037797 RepID=UPI0024533DC4|nr:oligosaccharide flippase family protein [Piscinibacter sp. XHJ-5]
MINLRGDLFAATASFGGLSLIRLVSSVILTRILYPEAYGIVTMVASVAFMMEMLSDVGIVGMMVRHDRAEDPAFVNTTWTIRLVRGAINAAALFVLAPVIAGLYDTPDLARALRIFSFWFVIYGLESMAFTLALRRRNSRISSYTELAATVVSTLFVIAYSYVNRDWHGMVYGMVLNRALITAASYFFYTSERPRLQFDRDVFQASLGFAKYSMPSSLLTMLVSQFDKLIFLKLFDIHLLGLYGLAGNMAGPINSLVIRITRTVLYPRCAANFRHAPATVRQTYYSENIKLLALILLLPAMLGGASALLVHVLFDHRYAYAAVILQALAVKVMIDALAAPAENVLVATGTPRPVLVSNLLRAGWVVPGTLIGYHFWGFDGFLYATALQTLPSLLYFLWLQQRRQLVIVRYEAMKLVYVAAVYLVTFVVSNQLMSIVTPLRLKAGA